MNVVLFQPEIPGNTGNVARTCVGSESTLHLVGHLGFELSDRHLKRAGLDYWPHLKLKVHADWEAFLASIPGDAPLYFFEKDAERCYWDAEFRPESYLVFGGETRGFPDELTQRYRDRFYRVPIPGQVRSLNLSTTAGVVLYEALRQTAPRPILT
jgi:tRNA (cytidine/uridine-2'-O-)-methyltransferase